jgi:predicted RNA-binding Zn ribbon-like protein
MRVNPYGEDPVRLAVALVNEPPASWQELADRCTAAGIVVPESLDESDLDEVRETLEKWLLIVDAATPEGRAGVLNRLLAGSSTHPALTNHGNSGWHLHYRPEDARLGAVVASMIYVGTALHLVGRGMHRLGRCQLQGCRRVYVDLSRPGTQRHCSPQCANRNAVRRHRALQAGS